jgi:hypothetical protein
MEGKCNIHLAGITILLYETLEKGRSRDENWRQDRDNPEDHSWHQRRMSQPAIPDERNKGHRKCDADRVMGNPSHHAFFFLQQSGDKL